MTCDFSTKKPLRTPYCRMGLSRQEVNLRRALAKCELMLKSNQKDDKLEKIVESLEDMLHDVKKNSEGYGNDSIVAYQNRISSIKSALGIATVLENSVEISERNDLLGVRHRNINKPSGIDDVNQLMEFQENLQTKVTDEILSFTRSLKEQSALANKIIKKDTEVVSQSAQLTETNYSKLQVESGKLGEHSKRACKCWMWVMLVIVLAVFINMVLFMKVMKKRY